jgi:hypothetical protein
VQSSEIASLIGICTAAAVAEWQRRRAARAVGQPSELRADDVVRLATSVSEEDIDELLVAFEDAREILEGRKRAGALRKG